MSPVRCARSSFATRLTWTRRSRGYSGRDQRDTFRDEADPEQFAFQMHGILLAFHQYSRLLGDPLAAERARRASTPCSMRPDPD